MTHFWRVLFNFKTWTCQVQLGTRFWWKNTETDIGWSCFYSYFRFRSSRWNRVHRDNFSFFVKLDKDEWALPGTKVINKINTQEYPPNKRQVEIRIIRISRAILISFWNILLIVVHYSDVWNRAWKVDCFISFYAPLNLYFQCIC